jgi:hypothetical protein
MAEYTEKCTISGINDFSCNTSSLNFNSGNSWAYVCGSTSTFAIATGVRFKTPSFVGGAATLALNFKMIENNVATNLRCAVCTSSRNWAKYVPNPCGGKYYVEDEYRIADGEIFCPQYSNPGNSLDSRYSIWVSTTIRAEKLKPSTNYVLFLYPMGDNSSRHYTYFENMAYDDEVSIEIGYNKGLVHIDCGSDHEAYQCYVDNGTDWDMVMPYIDNGSGWDLYT